MQMLAERLERTAPRTIRAAVSCPDTLAASTLETERELRGRNRSSSRSIPATLPNCLQ